MEPGQDQLWVPFETRDQFGRLHRRQRGFVRALRDAPLDWLLDRNRVPGLILGWALTVGSIAAAAVGVPVVAILALNWALDQTPQLVQLGRTAVINVRGGVHNPIKWDWSWWTRPQMHQPTSVALAPEAPLEAEMDSNFVNLKPTLIQRKLPVVARVPVIGEWLSRRHPAPARAIVRIEKRLIERAEAPEGTRFRRLAGQVDDWLNQRARIPGWFIGNGELAVGAVVGMPWVGNFLTNMVVGWIPSSLSAYLAWQTGDAYRFTRPGLRQRPTKVPGGQPRVTLETRGVALGARTVATAADLVGRGQAAPSVEGARATLLVPASYPEARQRSAAMSAPLLIATSRTVGQDMRSPAARPGRTDPLLLSRSVPARTARQAQPVESGESIGLGRAATVAAAAPAPAPPLILPARRSSRGDQGLV